MASSDMKMHFDQSRFRIHSQQLLIFALVIPIACLLSSKGAAQVVSSQIQDQVQEHFQAAQNAQQQGRLDDAAGEYKEVLRLQPGLPEVYANLGLVYYAQARFADSARALTSAAKLRPGMRGVDLWLGIDEVKLGNPVQAIPHLRAAGHNDPRDKLAQSWLGTALWDAGQRDAALLQLRAAATAFPDDPDMLFAAAEAYGKAVHQQTEELLAASTGTALSDRIYADTYAEQREWTKAEGHLNRALVRDPRSVEARLELANVFFEQARFQDAMRELDQASGLAPRSAAVLARSGLVMILIGQPQNGLGRIARAIELDRSEALDALGLPPDEGIAAAAQPDSAVSAACRQAAALLQSTNEMGSNRVAAAALWSCAGDQDAAMRAYRSLKPAPSASPAQGTPLQRAMHAEYAHRYSDAEDQFVRWLAAHPEDHDAQYDLLRVRRSLTMQQVDRLIAVAPDSYHVHQLLGQLYADRDEDEKAINEYRAVAAARPNLPGIHFWLGHLYWKHGDADDAVRELNRELEFNPLHAEANGELGAVLVAQDHPDEAIPHLESAIRSKPDLWPAYAQLGRAYASQKNYAQAEAMLKRAILHDSDGTVHYQLGMVFRAEGKTQQAAQAFAEVRAIKNEKMSAPPGGAADSGARP